MIASSIILCVARCSFRAGSLNRPVNIREQQPIPCKEEADIQWEVHAKVIDKSVRLQHTREAGIGRRQILGHSGPPRLSRAYYYGFIGALGGLCYALFAFVLGRYSSYDLTLLHLFVAPVAAGVVAMILGREEDCIRNQAVVLDRSRERFTSLTRSAITEDDWNVSFHDPHIPTCWQVKNCDAHDCPVHGKRHARCWMIAGTYCHGDVQGKFAQKIKDCSRCEVFIEALGDDPLNEINENFNSLMWALGEKGEMLSKANADLKARNEELESMNRKSREIADTDELTGLRNRGHFLRHLKQEFSKVKRFGQALSLIIVDLDGFKDINDEFGYQRGDEVLQRLAAMLQGAVGPNDYVARYGKEEFVIVLPGMDGLQATILARKLNSRLHRVAEDCEMDTSFMAAVFGIADYPDCASDSDSLLSAADSALLFARRNADGRVAYFRDLSVTELTETDLERLNSRLGGASLQTLDALAEAFNVNDNYTGENMEDMALIARSLARDLGLNDEQAGALALATRLHDIGKIGVPSSILGKTGKLSPEELALVKQHPEIGQKLLQEAEQIKDLILAILYHHERWDGKGYPERLTGEQIPLMARIVGIFDAYRAMRCDRPYRKALSKEQALTELRRGAGTQFDPGVVEQFLDLLEHDSCDIREREGRAG